MLIPWDIEVVRAVWLTGAKTANRMMLLSEREALVVGPERLVEEQEDLTAVDPVGREAVVVAAELKNWVLPKPAAAAVVVATQAVVAVAVAAQTMLPQVQVVLVEEQEFPEVAAAALPETT